MSGNGRERDDGGDDLRQLRRDVANAALLPAALLADALDAAAAAREGPDEGLVGRVGALLDLLEELRPLFPGRAAHQAEVDERIRARIAVRVGGELRLVRARRIGRGSVPGKRG